MTTEVADEHSVYIESLGGRYVWDEARSCWLEVDRVRRLEHDPPHCSVDTPPEVRPWPPLQWQCGLCRGPSPQRVPVMALGRRSALRAVHYRSCGMRLSRSPCARGCGVASE